MGVVGSRRLGSAIQLNDFVSAPIRRTFASSEHWYWRHWFEDNVPSYWFTVPVDVEESWVPNRY